MRIQPCKLDTKHLFIYQIHNVQLICENCKVPQKAIRSRSWLYSLFKMKGLHVSQPSGRSPAPADQYRQRICRNPNLWCLYHTRWFQFQAAPGLAYQLPEAHSSPNHSPHEEKPWFHSPAPGLTVKIRASCCAVSVPGKGRLWENPASTTLLETHRILHPHSSFPWWDLGP